MDGQSLEAMLNEIDRLKMEPAGLRPLTPGGVVQAPGRFCDREHV